MGGMAEVHPSAIVGDGVELTEGVRIGPWCRLEGEVRIGVGTELLERVSLRGPLRIGQHNTIYPGAALGFAPQDQKFDPDTDGAGIEIGNGNVLREGVTIHRATGKSPTRLGDRNYLMAFSHLGHDVQMGSDCLLANVVLLAGHVRVAGRVVFGGGSGVQQYARIGRLAMIAGNAALTQDAPPFCAVYRNRRVGSINVVGLRRAGLREHIRPLRTAFELLYHRGLSNRGAAERIREELGDDPLCAELADFIETTERGLCPAEPREHMGAAAEGA